MFVKLTAEHLSGDENSFNDGPIERALRSVGVNDAYMGSWSVKIGGQSYPVIGLNLEEMRAKGFGEIEIVGFTH